jgi:hypothetical protein
VGDLSIRLRLLGEPLEDAESEPAGPSAKSALIRSLRHLGGTSTLTNVAAIRRTIGFAVAALLLAACASSSHPNLPTGSPTTTHFSEPTESNNSANNRVCALIDNDYLFQPTVPATSLPLQAAIQAAIRIEGLLKHGTGLWLREAKPLQRAIVSNNGDGILKIFGYLQITVCETDGFTPAT